MCQAGGWQDVPVLFKEIVGVYLRRFCGVFIFFKLSTYDMAGSVLLSTVQSRSK